MALGGWRLAGLVLALACACSTRGADVSGRAQAGEIALTDAVVELPLDAPITALDAPVVVDAVGEGGPGLDAAVVMDAAVPVVDAPVVDAPVAMPVVDAPVAMPVDAAVAVDAATDDAAGGDDAAVAADAGPGGGGPGGGGAGAGGDEVDSFYACQAGAGSGVGLLPVLAAGLALGRRRRARWTPPARP